MKRLPLLVSLPHAGLCIPGEVEHLNILTPEEIAADGDEGAASVYSRLSDHVEHFVTTDIARAFVDLNRAEDDFRKDGVIKTHTCWDIPVYCAQPDQALIKILLDRYYFPYHRRLTELAKSASRLGVDCHTMATSGPPVGPDQDEKRPWICLGNDHHESCPRKWVELMAQCFSSRFHGSVTINQPFAGGWITRFHGRELPWVQLELSRDSSLAAEEKGQKVIEALQDFCGRMGWEEE